jgi:hypothetical protein
MRVAVINFTGNVGKSTISTHLLAPRLKAELIAVETINSSDGADQTFRGTEFGELSEHLLRTDNVVVDIGVSNVEAFAKEMRKFRGSHEDFDFFVVPTVKDIKQQKDTMATIEALQAIGVPAKKIRVIFNRLESDESVDSVFYPIANFHAATKAFTLKPELVIHENEIYNRLKALKKTLSDVVADETDYKKTLADARAADNLEAEEHAIHMIMAKRLATAAHENLESVYRTIFK